jgi:hypothetical protein
MNDLGRNWSWSTYGINLGEVRKVRNMSVRLASLPSHIQTGNEAETPATTK